MDTRSVLRRLERIEMMLLVILRKENYIMADLAALDQAISNVKAAADAIVAKLQEAQVPVDFTPEIEQLNAATQEMSDALAVPPPAEAPPAEEPPA